MNIVTSFALLAALATTALAQSPVTVRCTPTDGSAAGCYYCPGFEHVIKWIGTQMHSSTVNLLAFHDLDVVVEGSWNGSVIEVSSVTSCGTRNSGGSPSPIPATACSSRCAAAQPAAVCGSTLASVLAARP